MAEETKIEGIEQKTRRTAIKTAAQVAVTAPAVGLLLSAGTKAAQAYIRVGSLNDGGGAYTTADDFTAGSSDDATFTGHPGIDSDGLADDLYTF